VFVEALVESAVAEFIEMSKRPQEKAKERIKTRWRLIINEQ